MAINCPAGCPPTKLCLHPPGLPVPGECPAHPPPFTPEGCLEASWPEAGQALGAGPAYGLCSSKSRAQSLRVAPVAKRASTRSPADILSQPCLGPGGGGAAGSVEAVTGAGTFGGGAADISCRKPVPGMGLGAGPLGSKGQPGPSPGTPLLLPEWSPPADLRGAAGAAPVLSPPVLRGWTRHPAETSPDHRARPPLPSLALMGRAGESGWGPSYERKVGLGSWSHLPSEQAGWRCVLGEPCWPVTLLTPAPSWVLRL